MQGSSWPLLSCFFEMVMKTGLFPTPGSKKDRVKYPIWDRRYVYDASIEPFACAGHFSHWMLGNGIVKRAFLADIDPVVQIVYRCWQDDSLRQQVEKTINNWSKEVLSKGPKVVYENLKAIVDTKDTSDCVTLAAASLLIREFTFMSCLRANTKGRLNVKESRDKVASLKKKSGFVKNEPQLSPELLESLNDGWGYKMPWFGPDWRLHFSNDAHACIDSFELSFTGKAIALHDAPYWVPKGSRPGRRGTGALTPSYICHGDPQGIELFDLIVSTLERLLANPRIERVVMTNYISDPLCDAIERINKFGRDWRLTSLSVLTGGNNGINGNSRDDQFVEGFWEFGGEFTLGKYEQKSLLELAV